MKTHTSQPQFGVLRKILFPVYSFELKKVVPMGMIFFCVLFNYTILRNAKDAMVVHAMGAEAFAYLKLWFVAPAAILFMILYAKASNMMSNEKLFYSTISPFIVFFGLFAFVIYPNLDTLHMSKDQIAIVSAYFPKSLGMFVKIFGNWSYSMFYILSELWGSAILSLSFWQFANQITKVEEAKRFYAFFALLGQGSLMVAGELAEYFSDVQSKLPAGSDPWAYTITRIMSMIVISGVLCMIIYRWIYRNVLTDKRFYDKPELPGVPKGKKKATLMQSFKTIFSSPYLGLIAMLVICYGISVNVVEGVWKKQLELTYTSKNTYNVFMSNYTYWTGVVSIITLFIGSNILRIFRWTTAAIITPILILLGGATFYTFVLFKADIAPMVASLGSPMHISIMLGASILIISKATKYALFDLTKEMAYIPLDEDMKVKGKAVVDVVGGRLGKSGGAFTQFLFLTFISADLIQIAPYLACVFVVICVLWCFAVKALGKRVDALTIKTK